MNISKRTEDARVFSHNGAAFKDYLTSIHAVGVKEEYGKRTRPYVGGTIYFSPHVRDVTPCACAILSSNAVAKGSLMRGSSEQEMYFIKVLLNESSAVNLRWTTVAALAEKDLDDSHGYEGSPFILPMTVELDTDYDWFMSEDLVFTAPDK